MRVDINHGCGRTHHSFPALAACIWPDADLHLGDGAHALIARCDIESVMLYPSRADALRHLAGLAARGCGRRCTGDHSVASLLTEATIA